jgi:hypothetical protein
MVAVFYLGLEYLTLTGMITVAVCAILLEKAIAESMVIRKLGLGWRHLTLLKPVAKTAAISALAGVVTYTVYLNVHDYLLSVGEHFAEEAFATTKLSTLNFFGGSLVLAISAAVFVPVYVLAANFWGLIEDDEKRTVRNFLRKFIGRRAPAPLPDANA